MIHSSRVSIDFEKAEQLAELLASANIPSEQEASAHTFCWNGTANDLANCYFAIVAISHQTSPIGERRLQGRIDGDTKYGWDYLKEKFLIAANQDKALTTPRRWQVFTPQQLAELYRDKECGMTLNRVSERTLFINDLGRRLRAEGLCFIHDAFEASRRTIGGDEGFLQFLSQFQAFADPLCKKSLFFLSLAINECGWSPTDLENLLSPIDYHELRGHLRIGTIIVNDEDLSRELYLGLPVTDSEDFFLRKAAQEVNNWIAEKVQRTNSVLHYLLWNVFRSCCPRSAGETHCSRCGQSCGLPDRYRQMNICTDRCMFMEICQSAGQPAKLTEPPYVGHYY